MRINGWGPLAVVPAGRVVVGVLAVLALDGCQSALSASATVHVTLNVVDILSGPAPIGYTGASFGGAVTSTEAAPSVLYPYDQVQLPLDLSAPIVMWKRGGTTAAKAVRIGLRFPAGSSSPTFLCSAIVPKGPRLRSRFRRPRGPRSIRRAPARRDRSSSSASTERASCKLPSSSAPTSSRRTFAVA